MYLGIIFFTWPYKTIFIESPPQILGKFLIQFLVLESNGEFDTPISNLINWLLADYKKQPISHL